MPVFEISEKFEVFAYLSYDFSFLAISRLFTIKNRSNQTYWVANTKLNWQIVGFLAECCHSNQGTLSLDPGQYSENLPSKMSLVLKRVTKISET